MGTAHYWVAATLDRLGAAKDTAARAAGHQLGSNLVEEVAACLLGGYGMPYEVGLAAYWAVRDAGLLRRESTAQQIEQVLRRPLQVRGRSMYYRFPAQRATYLSLALKELLHRPAPVTGRELRDWLLQMRGIGPKTASWVARNHLRSDQVAIIDVHIHRAGVRAGVFDQSWTAARDYARLEAHFLAWADFGGVSAADLDATIWAESAYLARGSALRYGS
ncbi:8-oxoguanine DNA glycosylase [Mycobacteroides abscessus]